MASRFNTVAGASAGGDADAERQYNDSEDFQLMVRVIESMYHHNGLRTCRSYREVADDLGITVSRVIRLHRLAHELGLFEVIPVVPIEVRDIARLEDALKAKYFLQKVMLVDGRPEMLDDLDRARRRSVHTEITSKMAKRVVKHLDELVAADLQTRAPDCKEDFVVCVTWGRTVQRIARHLRSSTRPVRHPWMLVVGGVGVIDDVNPEPTESNVNAMGVARPYGGRAAQVPYAAFHPSISADVASQSEHVRQSIRRARDAKVMITGMGPIPGSEDGAAEVNISTHMATNEELCRSASERGAIGEICYWCFDKEGHPVQTECRSLGVGYDGLKAMARDPKRQLILVAGGDRRRLEPLRVALRARLASVLVTDTITAKYLNGELPKSCAL